MQDAGRWLELHPQGGRRLADPGDGVEAAVLRGEFLEFAREGGFVEESPGGVGPGSLNEEVKRVKSDAGVDFDFDLSRLALAPDDKIVFRRDKRKALVSALGLLNAEFDGVGGEAVGLETGGCAKVGIEHHESTTFPGFGVKGNGSKVVFRKGMLQFIGALVDVDGDARRKDRPDDFARAEIVFLGSEVEVLRTRPGIETKGNDAGNRQKWSQHG